ncbi:hypothetical protein BEN47_05725 [Hymenobacter lapidarius]|uniref:Uncharacterized protein n=1 Tax=Hymenobacter lapidarius TaxID=1908237 RepID=A0A1G1SS48_9BACT|nr:hypothetical protein [Hymenobacter lapidarius]OGX81446.1 hypothetical protein BEN47_05725 [Hymenobacter lapidarius]
MPFLFLGLDVIPAGRQLAFARHPAERAHIFRRVGGRAGPWHRVAVYARSPYLDEDVLAPGTFVEYYVHVQADADAGTLQVCSHLLSATT